MFLKFHPEAVTALKTCMQNLELEVRLSTE